MLVLVLVMVRSQKWDDDGRQVGECVCVCECEGGVVSRVVRVGYITQDMPLLLLLVSKPTDPNGQH